MIEENEKYFSGFPMIYCKFCNKINVIDGLNPMDCYTCGNCMRCLKKIHPDISCEDLAKISGSIPKRLETYQRILNTEDPNHQTYMKAVESLRSAGLTMLKISTFTNIQPSAIQIYKNTQLKNSYPHTKNKYFLSIPFNDWNSMLDSLYGEFPVDQNIGLIALPKKPDLETNRPIFIMYKIDYLDELINRTPTKADKTEEPKIFVHNNFFYIANSSSIIPIIIIVTEPA